jgi:hypothetical protein
MSIICPDIAFYTKILAQNLKNPGPQHLAASYHYIDYLEDTKYLALEYNKTAITTPIFSANNDLEGPLIEPAFIATSDITFMDDIRTR